MTNLLSLILLEYIFLGNTKVNNLFRFSPKSHFGFLEQISFIDISCVIILFVKVKMFCLFSFKQVSHVREEDRLSCFFFQTKITLFF